MKKFKAMLQNVKTDSTARHKLMTYGFGIIGWIVIAINYPFGWEMARYALF